ncbi:hypothetical protein DEO72_LG2g2723 [Vigna unguiculata]|uniref:Uncharacterized protein n=1 Tax=Vigna unguiculata TaxID=3917 RepID=A0A4D6L1N2_VIGUN|nr:hypothetical protein DEO72_LG2g2723 [Vigna unguiculata]
MLPRHHLHLHTTRNPSLHLHHVSTAGSSSTTGGCRLHQVRPPQFSLLLPTSAAMVAPLHSSSSTPNLLVENTTTAIDGEQTTVRAPTTTAAAPNAVNLHRSPSPHESATTPARHHHISVTAP